MDISKIDLNRPQRFSQFNQFNTTQQAQFSSKQQEPSKKVKIAAAVGSLVGSGAVLTCIAKKQGFPIKPSQLKEIPLKDWAFFKIAERGKRNQKLLKIEEKEILGLAAGSVAGGFAAGAITDRKNIKAKFRETLTQIFGNVAIPVAFVGGISRLYKNYESQIKSIMPTVKTGGKKNLKTLNKLSRSIPAIALTGTALGLGIITGSKVTNLINEKLFGQKTERKIKSSDFAPHVDDLCLAITLMGSENSPLATSITRTVPLFLSVPGYQVGKAQEQG